MHRVPRAITPLAFITGFAYKAAVITRNILYQSGILRGRRLKSPVLSIGNITTGGTGKTPLVIYTAKKVSEMGFVPVVLTRGYGRPGHGKEFVVQPGTRLQNPAAEIGDEPALIRRHVPEAWFGISKNRFSLASSIERNGQKNVFIMDDGFQHRKLHRDLDIVVVDAFQPFGSNRLFPRGTLREPLSGLSRCDSVVLNGETDTESASDPVIAEIRSLGLRADLFYCRQFIEKLIPFELWQNEAVPDPQGVFLESGFLVAALGNPLRFQADVAKFGIRVTGSRFFRDHYRLGSKDWQECVQSARKTCADTIVISEKDAVKISTPPDFPLLVSIQATLIQNEDAFERLLKSFL